MIAWEIFGILVCLILSGFFSSSETALTALGHPQTQKLIEARRWWSKALQLWADRPLAVLTCILIGNNIVNITASALATDLADRLLSHTAYAETAIPVAIGIMTLLLLTFGEITPKTLAKAKHRRLAGPMMAVLRGPWYLFYPFTWIFTNLTQLVMRVAGTSLEEPNVTEEDIEYLVSLGAREGSLEGDREKILQSVFEYTETSVREIMVPRTDMVALEIDTDKMTALRELMSSGHSRLPIYEEKLDNIVGLFYAKDMIKHLARPLDTEFHLRDYMRPTNFVPEQKKISDLLTEFKRNRVHMAIVVDEFGGTAGLITLEDILEEFFGEIHDEYDAEEVMLRPLDDTTWVADARVEIDELESRLEVNWPEHPEYDTLGGYIVTECGAVPGQGHESTMGNLCFEVLEADERRVIKVRIVVSESEVDSEPELATMVG